MNKSRLLLLSVFCCTAFLLNIGCDKKVGKAPVAAVVTTGVSTSTVTTSTAVTCESITYTSHIKKIIDTNCVYCHNAGLMNGNVSLINYDLVKEKADAGRIKARVIDGTPTSMPSGLPQLSVAQKSLITCWLNNGKKQ